MKLVMDMQALFDAVTLDMVAAIEANRQANFAKNGNEFNWHWHHCVGGSNKFWQKAPSDAPLFVCAKFYLANNAAYANVNPYVLLAAALQAPAKQVADANPTRLSIVFVRNYTSDMALDGLRAQGALA